MIFRNQIRTTLENTPRNRPRAGQGSQADRKNRLPLPRGNTYYARGKKAEFEKDLEKAKYFYRQAIRKGDRAESALKDLCSILHQEHKTQEACELLSLHKDKFKDSKKLENLYNTLLGQREPTKNSLNRILFISPVPENCIENDVTALFTDTSRIKEIKIQDDGVEVHFVSHSAARKTLETFNSWDEFEVQWMDIDGNLQGDAAYGPILHMKNARKELENLEIPDLYRDPSENTAVLLLGRSLYNTIDEYQ